MSESKYGANIPPSRNVIASGSPKGKNRALRREKARDWRLMLKEAYGINAKIDLSRIRRAMEVDGE